MVRVRHVVLIGLPGVGKSTVGRAVAERLNRDFIDLDGLIERSIGKSINRIFAEDGEAFFRKLEAEVSAEVAGLAPSVISPGGGWVLNPAAVAHLLDSSRIIYLRVTPDTAIRRMGRGVGRRPLLKGADDPYLAMRGIFEARKGLYERCAAMTVETGGIEKSNVTAQVIELVLGAERDFADEND
jgi:shikimate kinase